MALFPPRHLTLVTEVDPVTGVHADLLVEVEASAGSTWHFVDDANAAALPEGRGIPGREQPVGPPLIVGALQGLAVHGARSVGSVGSTLAHSLGRHRNAFSIDELVTIVALAEFLNRVPNSILARLLLTSVFASTVHQFKIRGADALAVDNVTSIALDVTGVNTNPRNLNALIVPVVHAGWGLVVGEVLPVLGRDTGLVGGSEIGVDGARLTHGRSPLFALPIRVGDALHGPLHFHLVAGTASWLDGRHNTAQDEDGEDGNEFIHFSK